MRYEFDKSRKPERSRKKRRRTKKDKKYSIFYHRGSGGTGSGGPGNCGIQWRNNRQKHKVNVPLLREEKGKVESTLSELRIHADLTHPCRKWLLWRTHGRHRPRDTEPIEFRE